MVGTLLNHSYYLYTLYAMIKHDVSFVKRMEMIKYQRPQIPTLMVSRTSGKNQYLNV